MKRVEKRNREGKGRKVKCSEVSLEIEYVSSDDDELWVIEANEPRDWLQSLMGPRLLRHL